MEMRLDHDLAALPHNPLPYPSVPTEKKAVVPRADLNTVVKRNMGSPVGHRSSIRRLFGLYPSNFTG